MTGDRGGQQLHTLESGHTDLALLGKFKVLYKKKLLKTTVLLLLLCV